MYRFNGKLLFLIFISTLLAVTAFAQSEAQIESDQVKRVGTHLSCQCGACTENINCMMSAGQCHFCKPARTKVFQMQTSGMDDTQILAAFVTEYGQKIFRADPNSFFWLIPYISLGLGAIVVGLILRRVLSHHPMKPAVAGGPQGAFPDDPALARYRDAIEKDTARLD